MELTILSKPMAPPPKIDKKHMHRVPFGPMARIIRRSLDKELMRVAKLCIAVALVLAVAGCGGSDTREVRETRVVSAPSGELPHERVMPPSGTVAPALPPGHPPMSAYAWELPEGWSEIEATPMRIGNFRLDASDESECYVAVLTGAAGGVEANVNRWRRQMGQSDLAPEEIAALPSMEALGNQATLVEIPGAFTGMDGRQQSDSLLLGLICPMDDGTLFVKMTGPKDAVGAERDRFRAFCMSLRERGTPDEAPAQADQ